jgi:hypothetical protein
MGGAFLLLLYVPTCCRRKLLHFTRGDKYPDWVLHGCNVVHFGTQLLTCCFQLPNCNLNLQAAGCSETLVLIYSSQWCHVLVDRNDEAANFVLVGGNGKVTIPLFLN